MSAFRLDIDTSRASLSNRYGQERPSEADMAESRRRSVASLLRTVALMLEQGRDLDKIRDHTGSVCGSYTLRHY